MYVCMTVCTDVGETAVCMYDDMYRCGLSNARCWETAVCMHDNMYRCGENGCMYVCITVWKGVGE